MGELTQNKSMRELVLTILLWNGVGGVWMTPSHLQQSKELAVGSWQQMSWHCFLLGTVLRKADLCLPNLFVLCKSYPCYTNARFSVLIFYFNVDMPLKCMSIISWLKFVSYCLFSALSIKGDHLIGGQKIERGKEMPTEPQGERRKKFNRVQQKYGSL